MPNLQSSGAVVTFIYKHLGMPVVSPAVFERRGTMFRQAVTRFAENNDIPLIKFAKGDRKLDVMRPHLEAAAGEGRSRVAAIGVAQEFQRVWEGRKRDTTPGKAVTFTFARSTRTPRSKRVPPCTSVPARNLMPSPADGTDSAGPL